MLNQFELYMPASLQEALDQYEALGQSCKILAGGTDVLVEMHGGHKSYGCLMDIKKLDELKGISFDPLKGLVIGALTTHRELEMMPLLKAKYTALQEGARQVGCVQTRYRGTIGGNICNAVPSGDTLGPLLALNARLVLASKQGTREVSFGEFFLGAKKTVLQPGELLMHIIVPEIQANSASAYTKFTRRNSMDLALLGASAVVTSNDRNTCDDIRISLTTSAPTVIRALKTEAFLKGRELTSENLEMAGQIASEEARPRSSWRSSEEYRREVLKTIVPRTIATAFSRI